MSEGQQSPGKGKAVEVLRQCLAEHWPRTEVQSIAVLEELLRSAEEEPAADLDRALRQAGVMAHSLLTAIDFSGESQADILPDIRSYEHSRPGLTGILVRLVDREAPDRFTAAGQALAALVPVAQAIRDAERRKPKASGAAAPPPSRETTDDTLTRRLALTGCGIVALVGILIIVLKVVSEVTQVGQVRSTSATASVTGTTVQVWPRERAADLRSETSWAFDTAVSSNEDYAERASGWSDQYPDCGESGRAWYGYPDGRSEWLLARFGLPVEVHAVVVVETLNPGTVAAIDDLVDYDQRNLGSLNIVRLWEGDSRPGAAGLIGGAPGDACRALIFRLKEPRTTTALRVVLNTSLIPGANHIDSIGVLTESGEANLFRASPKTR